MVWRRFWRPAVARTGPCGHPLFSAAKKRAKISKWRQMQAFSNSVSEWCGRAVAARLLPDSCPVPSCPAAGSCPVPARFLPRSARFVRLGRRPASHPRPISKVADLGSRLGLSIQARGPDGLVVGFRRFGIGRWKARHSTFPTGCLRAKTDEVSSSTFGGIGFFA